MRSFIFSAIIFLLLGTASSAQNLVQEGQGLGNISVGISTRDDVISHYGEDFKLIEHGKYSHQVVYEKLGLSFYYCYADPKQEIFIIKVKKPYEAITGKGIVLGSLREDVIEAYGFPKDLEEAERVEHSNIVGGYVFAGIGFQFSATTTLLGDGTNVSEVWVNQMDIFEESGLRQCHARFPQNRK